jgi:16S rRNA (guanine527-N7)-methyltransferase
VEFAGELARVLPEDIPHRDLLIEKSAAHLSLILKANEQFNLTRIVNAPEAAIKHVFDSVAPWRFFAGARRVLDAGTGAGFPGVPLSVVLPEVRFTLAESTQKKARFVDSAAESLHLPNVEVLAERAEQIALAQRPDIITARAVAPLHRLLDLFAKPLKHGATLILYKGPEFETELAEARRHRIKVRELWRYELPDGLGTRVLLAVDAVKPNRHNSVSHNSVSKTSTPDL